MTHAPPIEQNGTTTYHTAARRRTLMTRLQHSDVARPAVPLFFSTE